MQKSLLLIYSNQKKQKYRGVLLSSNLRKNCQQKARIEKIFHGIVKYLKKHTSLYQRSTKLNLLFILKDGIWQSIFNPLSYRLQL